MEIITKLLILMLVTAMLSVYALADDFSKTFKGSINGKYKITMTLTKTNNKLNGSYSYNSKEIPLELQGSIDKSGNISLNEFDDNGTITGIFKGKLADEKITGNWSKPDGGKPMPFSIATAPDKYAKYYGTYSYEYNGELTISQGINKEKLKFNISNSTGRCMADVEGEIINNADLYDTPLDNYTYGYSPERKAMLHTTQLALEDYKTQHYSDSTNNVASEWLYLPQEDNERGIFMIFYKNHTIYVEEVALEGYYHHGGAACGITGIYTK